MIANAQTTSFYQEAYAAHAAQLPGRTLPWLQASRAAAYQAFCAKGFPGQREEDWRYTNLALLHKQRFTPGSGRQVEAGWLAGHRLDGAACLVLVNGRYHPELSSLQDLDTGLSVQDMAGALSDDRGELEHYLGQALAGRGHSLIDFNTAWFQDGVVLRLAAHCRPQRPLQILHVVSDEAVLAASRQLWLLAPGSRLEVTETFVGTAGQYFTAAVTEAFVATGAELIVHKVQDESAQAVHFGGLYLRQAAGSRFEHHNFALGGQLARSEVHADLLQAAECGLYGLYLGSGRRHVDNLTRINHQAPDGVSREYYKGVLDERSRGVFQGRVVVETGAQHTDSEMNNRNLLLSADAEIDTKPQLEIYADDVKCSHGVTVGQLDEKSVFYLQSRGVDADSARHILTFAFANEMVDKVGNPALRDALHARLRAHFPQVGR